MFALDKDYSVNKKKKILNDTREKEEKERDRETERERDQLRKVMHERQIRHGIYLKRRAL